MWRRWGEAAAPGVSVLVAAASIATPSESKKFPNQRRYFEIRDEGVERLLRLGEREGGALLGARMIFWA